LLCYHCNPARLLHQAPIASYTKLYIFVKFSITSVDADESNADDFDFPIPVYNQNRKQKQRHGCGNTSTNLSLGIPLHSAHFVERCKLFSYMLTGMLNHHIK
jgi:hypothetical protein